MPETISVRVSRLDARIPEGVPIRWRGREFPSGPLEASLAGDSTGVLDYSARQARLEFQVKLEFPEFAATLRELGFAEPATAPVRATIHSSGDILDDHSFALNGPCDLRPHELFGESTARMLPGT